MKIFQNKLNKIILSLAVVVLTFIYGFGFGKYNWPPYNSLKELKENLTSKVSLTSEQEFINNGFSDELIGGYQILAPIQSIDGITQVATELIFPTSEYFHAYDSITIHGSEYILINNNTEKVLKVSYELCGYSYNAYAYTTQKYSPLNNAALIIPGSGNNQSSQIYNNVTESYQYGIMDALGSEVDKFIFIKPNEDCFAFHDGKKKLNPYFIICWQLDHGSSYSASYLVGSMAIVKYLKTVYSKTIVTGLSQGGRATLLNALQTEPDIAMVVSGYSILNEKIKWSDFEQIVIPGLKLTYSLDSVKNMMSNSKTDFLFTYGMQEGAAYKVDIEKNLTCNYFGRLKNFECVVHNGGHQFPQKEITVYLKDKL